MRPEKSIIFTNDAPCAASQLDAEYPGIATMVHVRGILGPQLAKLWSHPDLLNIAEQLVGSEVAGHPVWNLRAKMIIVWQPSKTAPTSLPKVSTPCRLPHGFPY